jgi:hypothetical protein
MIVLALALGACGNDGGSGAVEEDRRYATDPEPAPTELPATETAEPSATLTPPTFDASGVSPEASPDPVYSQVTRVFALLDGNVVVVDVLTGLSEVIAQSDEGGEISLIVPVPDGSALAVIRDRLGDERVFDLEIMSADGAVQRKVEDLSAVLGAGRGKFRGNLAADWDANGQRLAVVFPDGGGLVVHRGGSSEVLLTPSQAPAPIEVAWSPDGEAIAFTTRDLDDESPYLAIGGVRVLPLDPVRIAGTGGQRPIHALSWQPDGETLLAIQGSGSEPDSIGGDLIEIDRGTLSARFALGGSRFGPGARILIAEPAPDGRSWAIVTVAPQQGRGLQATVWQAVSTLSEVTRLELGENPPVAGVIWTTAGITVSLFKSGEVHLASFGPDGQPNDPAVPQASPEVEASTPVPTAGDALASPVASPEASPDASPIP